MARNTGVSTETTKRMLMDAGAVYINYGSDVERLLGATREGSSFEIEQTVREIAIDGARGPVKGARRVVEEHVRLTVNLLEMNAANVSQALVGASVVADTTTETVTRSLDMQDVEYLDNIALVADYSGSSEPVIITLKNVIADGGFSLSATDREESVVELQFTAHVSPDNLDASPFDIVFPLA